MTDHSAANTLMDLEALDQYNNLHLKLSEKKGQLTASLSIKPHRLHPHLKTTISKIQPSLNASSSVTAQCA
jgi:hypothetical protein